MEENKAHQRLKNQVARLVGCPFLKLALATEALMFDFGSISVYSRCLTRIIRDNDILFTTRDAQNTDEEDPEKNDEWYFYNRYKAEIVGGRVLSAELDAVNDLILKTDNGITVSLYIENGHCYYDGEHEQWRMTIGCDSADPDTWQHVVVYNKSVEFSTEE